MNVFEDGIQNQTAIEDIHSFLLVGQSNMAGRGVLTPENALTDPKCYMLRMGRWQRMTEPVNVDRQVLYEQIAPRSGANLAASFAVKYAHTYDANVGLIPCADGGTEIRLWAPGGLLFDNAVTQAKLAMRTSTLKAILWHQGETDCSIPGELDKYAERFRVLMAAFREELGDVPILVGELGYPECGFYGTPAEGLHCYNQMLPEIAASVPNCAVISAAGLMAKPDGLHFDTPALREFGERYFEAYRSICSER